jgi:predicted 3-demethylubiquinone-9 3-methyltransferase (glyoxalase superfamily)
MDITRNKIATCLLFDHGQARQAAEFYAATFPDSYVVGRHASPSDYPAGKQGDELTVEFTVLGMPFLGLNGGPHVTFNQAVSFQVYTDTQEETDRYWNAIVADGGQESQCSWCKDKFGLSWQIVPRALLAAMTDPDKAAAKRAMEAMMGMNKIDIAAIERARAGKSLA